VVLYLLNCALFNTFFAYKTLNTIKKGTYKNLLHEVGRSWMTEVQDRSESKSNDLQLPEKQTTPRGPKQDPPGRLSSDLRIYKLKKKFWWKEKKKRSILQDSVKCVLYIRKHPARQCKVCAAYREVSCKTV
jgi:hypothetical protein